MATLPILYSFRRCPYAIRARLALAVAQVDVEHREVVLKDKPAAMLALSPKGTVPVLLLPDGQVIDESLEIMSWALQQSDPQDWLSADADADAATAQALIALNDGPFKAALDRYKYPERHPSHNALEHREQAIELFIADLNQRLCARPYLMGDRPTLPDMAILPFIRQFAQVDVQWFATAPFPALRHWLQALTESRLFITVMAKHQSSPSDCVHDSAFNS